MKYRGIHAIVRAQDRYGVTLTNHDIRTIEMMVACGDTAALLKRDGDDHWLIDYAGTRMAIVVARDTGHIKTFLPKDCIP